VDNDRRMLRERPRDRGAMQPRFREQTPVNLYNRPVNLGRVDRTAQRMPVQRVRPAIAPGTRPNDVYAGRDGKVYQRDPNGGWKVNQGRGWMPARIPATPQGGPGTMTGGGRGGFPGGGNAGGDNRGGGNPGGGNRGGGNPGGGNRGGGGPGGGSPGGDNRGGGNPGGGGPGGPGGGPPPTRTNWPPRAPQPMPVQPGSGSGRPRFMPPARPAPPPIAPEPGNLERVFRARERSRPGVAPAPSRPAPRPAPNKPDEKKEKPGRGH
jgi:hypothetical protein